MSGIDFDKEIAQVYRDMELYLIESMRRNLAGHLAEEAKTGFSYPQWQAEKLKELKRYQRENQKIIKSRTRGLSDEMSEHMKSELRQGSKHEFKRYKKAIGKGYKPAKAMRKSFFKVNDRKISGMINALHNDLGSANTAVLRMMNDTYRQTIFRAGMYASNGVMTETQAYDMAVKDFLTRGINCIEYRDGRRVNIADYTSMAVRTANQRAYMAGEGEFRKSIGRTLVLISHHATACKLCKPFERKVLIDDVYSGGKQEDGDYMLLSQAMKLGLFHPRCRHGLGTYYPELEDINHYNNEENDVADYGRYDRAHIENMVQRYKRLSVGSVDPENVARYQAKLEEWERKLDDSKKINDLEKLEQKRLQEADRLVDPPVIIAGVDCTVTEGTFGFGDGYGGVRKSIDAVTYETPDGTRFVFPKKYNKTQQQMTPEQAIRCWYQVPEEVRSKAQKTIEFVDYYNPADSYWRKKYKNFPHSYATGGDKITFYRYDYAHQDEYVTGTYCHEAGHLIDTSIATQGDRFSSENLWTNAMKNDTIISKMKSPTKYGENSAVEDFAESVAEFVRDETEFTNKFPNRAKIIKSIIGRVK